MPEPLALDTVVRVLAPFADTFPGNYAIKGVMPNEEGYQYLLEGVHGWFADRYVEIV